jgi:hypothetical protein
LDAVAREIQRFAKNGVDIQASKLANGLNSIQLDKPILERVRLYASKLQLSNKQDMRKVLTKIYDLDVSTVDANVFLMSAEDKGKYQSIAGSLNPNAIVPDGGVVMSSAGGTLSKKDEEIRSFIRYLNGIGAFDPKTSDKDRYELANRALGEILDAMDAQKQNKRFLMQKSLKRILTAVATKKRFEFSKELAAQRDAE